MAHLLVSTSTGAMGSLIGKLGSMLSDEYKLLKDVRDDINFLKNELEAMQAFLLMMADVEEPDHLQKLRADAVREQSYEIEDKIDKFMLNVVNELSSNSDGLRELFRKSMNMITSIKTRHKIAKDFKEIKIQMMEVTARYSRYKVDESSSNPGNARVDPRILAIYRDASELVGIDGPRDEVVKWLTTEESESTHQPRVLSIVGYGGLGKTTLAKQVYDKIRANFECRAFVSISRNPDIKKILGSVLSQIQYKTVTQAGSEDVQHLVDMIREFLKDKRYLIIIDDLWDKATWNIISCSLPSNHHGSQVITTTRVNNIAECCSMCKDLIYEIRPLGYQDSKRLFLQRCFGSESSCHDALAEVDEILKICGGMPLAIVSIASATFRSSAEKIKELCKEIIMSLRFARRDLDCVEVLTRILSYSYFDLPNALRACLLYLAVSAENQRVQRDNLVRKWIAEGLIPVYDDSSPEEVAQRYFDELISRNVIQPVKYVNCLGKETYEVTYMMLYSLRLLWREESFATCLPESEPHVKMPIRLLMQCSDSEHSVSTERVNLTNAPANSVSINHLRYVRVLDLDGCKDLDNSAMNAVCLLIKLKYLSLKHTQVTEIPPEISNLQNLETLDVRQTQVKDLPKEVLLLRELTHLHFGQSGSFGVKLPVGSDQLESVEVMGTVDSRECSERAMKEISELRKVRVLEVVLYDGPTDREQNDKLLSFVGKCINLKSLTIYGDSNPSDKLSPESANFPQLEKLEVAGRFVKVPGWIAQLRTLTLLVIRVCKLEESDMVIIGGLPCLSVLSLALVALPRKQVTITSSAGFARLEVFCFDCRVPWVSFEEKAIPNLKHLQLKLYSGPAGKLPSGILLLESLNMVILLYSSQYAASVGVIETVDVLRRDAASHANRIELSINGDHEIFPSNRSADRGVAGTEFDINHNGLATGAEIVEVP